MRSATSKAWPSTRSARRRLRRIAEKRAAGNAVRLIKAFEAWCKNRQMAEINFGINSVDDQKELDRLGRFAMRLGYRKIGESYVK